VGKRNDWGLKGLISHLETLGKRLSAETVVLFGSRATQTWRDSSDADILVVSPLFEGKSIFDRIAFVLDNWTMKDIPVEPVCLSPDELDDSLGSPILWEILEHGMVISSGPSFDRIQRRFESARSQGILDRKGSTWSFPETGKIP
jgi:predicted nucleotidyltransferase